MDTSPDHITPWSHMHVRGNNLVNQTTLSQDKMLLQSIEVKVKKSKYI